VKFRLLEWLACPACRCEDLTLEPTKTVSTLTFRGCWEDSEVDLDGLSVENRELTEIEEGKITCDSCGANYPITSGIPRMNTPGQISESSTGHKLTQFDGAAPEYEANFSDMTAPLTSGDFIGKLVLDVGCGFGRHSYFAAQYGAEVVAMDSSSEAVEAAAANCKSFSRVHAVQGDLFNPPLKRSIFDIAFCFGVLHHIDQPEEGFKKLKELICPSGKLQVWVYGPRQGALAHVSKWLRGTAAEMDDDSLQRLSIGLASSLRAFSHTPYRLLRHTPLLNSIVTHLPAHDHHKWPFDVVVADVYDRLRIPVTAWIKGEELERWYGDDGYADISVTRRVRNNESFRGTGTRR